MNMKSPFSNPPQNEAVPIQVQTRELRLTSAIHTLLHVSATMGPLVRGNDFYGSGGLSDKASMYVEKTVMNTCHRLDQLTEELVETTLSSESDKVIKETLDAQKEYSRSRLKLVEEAKRPYYLLRASVKQIKPGLFFASSPSMFTTDQPPVYGMGDTPEEAMKSFDHSYHTGQQPACDLTLLFADSPMARIIREEAQNEPDSPDYEEPDDSGNENPVTK